MKPAPFAYYRPASLDEALEALARLGPDARVLAGGQSLVPALNMRLAQPSALVDINRLPGLDGIRLAPEGLVIGALARQESVLRSPLVARHAPLIAQAMPHVAHLALRNRGTFGGSLALGDPAAELPACAVALDAVLRVAHRSGEREIPAARFFRGIYATALEPGEILVAAVIPPRDDAWRFHFDELARRHGDYALVALAAGARVDGGVIVQARLVFAGVGITPVRAARCERAVAGRRPDAATVAEAGRELDADLEPPGDVHASAALRRHLARVLMGRALAALAGSAS